MSNARDAAADLAHRFLDAIETGDADAMLEIYAEDAVIWHNTDQAVGTPIDNVATLKRFIGLAPFRRYDKRQIDVFDGGFVERHVLIAERSNGKRLELPACLVCTVAGGRITRLDEYFDAAPIAEWLA